MGRKARPQRVNEHECYSCSAPFDAVRNDARYCSPRCRQQMSRSMRAIAKLKASMKKKKGR